MDYIRKHWIATLLVVAVVFGTFLQFQISANNEAAREQSQRDQITFNLGACQRGDALRKQTNDLVAAVETLRDATSVAMKLAAVGGSAEPQQADFAAVGRAVDAIQVEKVDDPNCATLVQQQTPAP